MLDAVRQKLGLHNNRDLPFQLPHSLTAKDLEEGTRDQHWSGKLNGEHFWMYLEATPAATNGMAFEGHWIDRAGGVVPIPEADLQHLGAWWGRYGLQAVLLDGERIDATSAIHYHTEAESRSGHTHLYAVFDILYYEASRCVSQSSSSGFHRGRGNHHPDRAYPSSSASSSQPQRACGVTCHHSRACDACVSRCVFKSPEGHWGRSARQHLLRAWESNWRPSPPPAGGQRHRPQRPGLLLYSKRYYARPEARALLDNVYVSVDGVLRPLTDTDPRVSSETGPMFTSPPYDGLPYLSVDGLSIETWSEASCARTRALKWKPLSEQTVDFEVRPGAGCYSLLLDDRKPASAQRGAVDPGWDAATAEAFAADVDAAANDPAAPPVVAECRWVPRTDTWQICAVRPKKTHGNNVAVLLAAVKEHTPSYRLGLAAIRQALLGPEAPPVAEEYDPNDCALGNVFGCDTGGGRFGGGGEGKTGGLLGGTGGNMGGDRFDRGDNGPFGAARKNEPPEVQALTATGGGDILGQLNALAPFLPKFPTLGEASTPNTFESSFYGH